MHLKIIGKLGASSERGPGLSPFAAGAGFRHGGRSLIRLPCQAATSFPRGTSHTRWVRVRANLKPTEHRAGALSSHALGRHIGCSAAFWQVTNGKRPGAFAGRAKTSLCSQGPTWALHTEGSGAGGGCPRVKSCLSFEGGVKPDLHQWPVRMCNSLHYNLGKWRWSGIWLAQRHLEGWWMPWDTVTLLDAKAASEWFGLYVWNPFAPRWITAERCGRQVELKPWIVCVLERRKQTIMQELRLWHLPYTPLRSESHSAIQRPTAWHPKPKPTPNQEHRCW